MLRVFVTSPPHTHTKNAQIILFSFFSPLLSGLHVTISSKLIPSLLSMVLEKLRLNDAEFVIFLGGEGSISLSLFFYHYLYIN